MTKKEDRLIQQGVSLFQSKRLYHQELHYINQLNLGFELALRKSHFSNPIF